MSLHRRRRNRRRSVAASPRHLRQARLSAFARARRFRRRNALKQALADPALPKAIHDSKAATHALAERGITLAGVQHDPLLYAYLLDPTYTKYSLADVAFRTFNLKMSDNLGEAADLTLRLATKLATKSPPPA